MTLAPTNDIVIIIHGQGLHIQCVLFFHVHLPFITFPGLRIDMKANLRKIVSFNPKYFYLRLSK